METIKQIIMKRDGYSEQEADKLIETAKDDLQNRLDSPDDFDNAYEICADYFGLETDYIMELI